MDIVKMRLYKQVSGIVKLISDKFSRLQEEVT